jgi:hypothetical protein
VTKIQEPRKTKFFWAPYLKKHQKSNIKPQPFLQPSTLIHARSAHISPARFLSIAALTKLTKSGCGFITVDLYSGWNWAAKKYG